MNATNKLTAKPTFALSFADTEQLLAQARVLESIKRMESEKAPKAKAPKAPKAPKAKAPKAPKAKPAAPVAKPKGEKVTNLTDAQKATQANFILAATAVDGASEKAAIAIHACYSIGLHTAYGLSLNDYVVRTLSAVNIAKSTVYYLRDIGYSFAVLGIDRARLFPLDGLRTLASSCKGDAKALKAMALKAQGGRTDSKPTLKSVRECAKPSVGKTHAQMVGQLFGMACNLGGTDMAVVVALLTEALAKATHALAIQVQAPVAPVEAPKAKKPSNKVELIEDNDDDCAM
jgi:hypothetical protein